MSRPTLRFHDDLLIAPREFANSVRIGEDSDYRAMHQRELSKAGLVREGERRGYGRDVIDAGLNCMRDMRVAWEADAAVTP